MVAGVPGFVEIDPLQLVIDRIEGDAEAARTATAAQITGFLQARNVVALLAKSGEQLLKEMKPGRIGPGASKLEQAHVELLQAFALAAGRGRPVPGSPKSMMRLWDLVRRNADAYLASTEPAFDADESALLARRVRLRTMFYRNVFSSDDAADVIPALISHMDAASERELGYKLSDFARALFAIIDEIGARFSTRVEREQVFREGAVVEGAIVHMLESSEWARRMWRPMVSRTVSPKDRGWAAFQLAEMLCEPLFTFQRTELVARFGEPVTRALFTRALALGALNEDNLKRIYLANPIWERPFVVLDADTLFLPLPVLVVSFCFAILEGLIDGNPTLQVAYSDARARYLEDDVERIVRMSLPSSTVHRGVTWKDPDTEVTYEHDVVAVLGMQVLIFEAKSGKLASAARRGGVKSLQKNFENLFVEPGRQGARLEALLASRRSDVKLVDRDGQTLRFDDSGPSVVHKFGVCMEQFASVTSSRRLFKDMGLLASDQEWAPALTLSELRMISERLDTEVSFLHYLTRRATADDVLDFVADEQDLLSVYLTNGFVLDASALEGQTVTFLNADAAVRGRASPRSNRRAFATPGISLPPAWKSIAKEIYETSHRHRFDFLITILNQHPGVLNGMASQMKRWRSGIGSQGKTLSARMPVGARVFALAVHMDKERPVSEPSWKEQSRLIGRGLSRNFGATDCVVILKVRRSEILTFDAISFFRFSHAPSEQTKP